MNIIDRVARKIVRNHHVIANPDLYTRCEKRTKNERFFLSDDLLKNCKVLSCRESMLDHMEPNKVWAEVGVAEGYFSDLILKKCSPSKLYMIEYGYDYCVKLRERFEKEIESGLVEILEGDSVQMLKQLEDNSLDYVFLDATHDYEHPKNELEICSKKVKNDGIIMGHDYTRFSMWESLQYGVVEAVNEFAVGYQYEMVYLTLDILNSNSSYALKKIEN